MHEYGLSVDGFGWYFSETSGLPVLLEKSAASLIWRGSGLCTCYPLGLGAFYDAFSIVFMVTGIGFDVCFTQICSFFFLEVGELDMSKQKAKASRPTDLSHVSHVDLKSK